jgi:hypothetical protein
MNVDDRIRAALQARAAQITEADLRPAPTPVPLRPSRWRWGAPALAAAAVAAVAVAAAVLSTGSSARHAARPAGPRLSTRSAASTRPPVSARSGSPSTRVPPRTPSSSGSAAHTVPSPGSGGACLFADAGACSVVRPHWYVPLWPFADYAQARRWQTVDGPAGHSPWHSDAVATTEFYVQNVLGFADLTVITSSRVTTDDAAVGIGFTDPGGRKQTAAVVHLVRYERNLGERSAGWEVVGAENPTFAITSPPSGATVTSPVVVAGRITGVDENIRLWIRSMDGVVGSRCCLPAGGTASPWSATVAFHAPGGTALAVVASTGGHLQAHERFTLIGVWAGH